jgi:hypothetical protein
MVVFIRVGGTFWQGGGKSPGSSGRAQQQNGCYRPGGEKPTTQTSHSAEAQTGDPRFSGQASLGRNQ